MPTRPTYTRWPSRLLPASSLMIQSAHLAVDNAVGMRPGVPEARRKPIGPAAPCQSSRPPAVFRDRDNLLRTRIPQNAVQRAEHLRQLHAGHVGEQVLVVLMAADQPVV